jgi:hypothetical protein
VTRSCGPNPELVGAAYWLPVEPFELAWASLVGCNHLGCELCGQRVHSHVLSDGKRRHYECNCQRRDEIWCYRVDADPDDLTGGPTRWRCLGHPDFVLPATLDGVVLTAGSDWPALARDGLAHPPFTPPGVELPAAWVTRAYRLLADDAARARLGQAVADCLGDGDAAVVGGAFDFFISEPAAAGAERLALVVGQRQTWLQATSHPRRPGSTLLEVAAVAVHERLLVVDDRGVPIDGAALTTAKILALAGIGPATAPFTFRKHDSPWLWSQAGALVNANRDWLSRIVHLSRGATAAERDPALRAIAALGADAHQALYAAIARIFSDPERSQLLSSLPPPSPGA